MATPAAVLAIIRSSGQALRSDEDKLAFAVHAAILACGFRLIGVGDDAKLEEAVAPDAADAPVAGWDAAGPERYTFLYAPDDAAAPPAAPLLAKLLSLGSGALLASLASGARGAPEPRTLELSTARYVASGGGGGIAQSLRNVDELCAEVATAVQALRGGGVGGGGGGGGGAAATAATAGPARQPEEPGHDPLRVGPPMQPRPRGAFVGVGGDDLDPFGGGFAPPPGFAPPLGGPGGGMHVGPGHPYFADRARHPELLPPHHGGGGDGGGFGLPPGARWDPIRPEGMEGWRPDDFQRPQPPPGVGPGRGGGPPVPPPVHPDVMQPGPPGRGGGADFDSMFG